MAPILVNICVTRLDQIHGGKSLMFLDNGEGRVVAQGLEALVHVNLSNEYLGSDMRLTVINDSPTNLGELRIFCDGKL